MRISSFAAAAVFVVAAAPHLAGCCCCADIFARNFAKYECRSKQSEAKGNLKALAVAQAAYREEHQRYATQEELAFEPSGETLRYEYLVIEADRDHFVAEARGKDEMIDDVWRVAGDAAPPVALHDICKSDVDEEEPRPEHAPPIDGPTIQHVRY